METHILPELEKDGFKLLKSGPSLKKKHGAFEWIVNFQASRYNQKNVICQYNPYFTVTNSNYRKYLKNMNTAFNSKGRIGSTRGIQHWDKSKFSLEKKEAYFLEEFDFVKYDNLELVDQLIQNIREVGIPFFEMMSDFNGIMNFFMSNEQILRAPTLIDMCYLFDKKSEIQKVFNWYDDKKVSPAVWVINSVEERRKKWLSSS